MTFKSHRNPGERRPRPMAGPLGNYTLPAQERVVARSGRSATKPPLPTDAEIAAMVEEAKASKAERDRRRRRVQESLDRPRQSSSARWVDITAPLIEQANWGGIYNQITKEGARHGNR